MAGTRSSARKNSPHEDATAGTKRKIEAASPIRDHKAAKKQTTIEETIGGAVPSDALKDAGMKEVSTADTGAGKQQDDDVGAEGNSPETKQGPTAAENTNDENQTEAVQESSQREKNLPSSILEKGVIYFFTRNRVSVEEAESVGDLQRTYFVLRPLPLAAKLGEGVLPDLKNNRLFALPKKVFPKSQ
jgi:hypothetical protein